MNKRSPKISRLGNILSMIPAKTSCMWIPIILIIIVLFKGISDQEGRYSNPYSNPSNPMVDYCSQRFKCQK